MPTPGPNDVAFRIRGPIAPADLHGLCNRVCATLEGAGSIVWCEVDGVEADAVCVDALARLQLGAKRRGCRVVLCNASAELVDLVRLMGLTNVLSDAVAIQAARGDDGRAAGRGVTPGL